MHKHAEECSGDTNKATGKFYSIAKPGRPSFRKTSTRSSSFTAVVDVHSAALVEVLHSSRPVVVVAGNAWLVADNAWLVADDAWLGGSVTASDVFFRNRMMCRLSMTAGERDNQ
jgi:hypothetical protein